MRKLDSKAEFGSQRSRFLLENFRKSIATQSEIAINNAFRHAAQAPAPRFWVSEARAAAILGKMLSGEDPTESMNPEKRRMYKEMFVRFMRLREERPDACIYDLAFEVVNSTAPSSYISWQRARTLIYDERRRLREERRTKVWK